MPKNQYDKKRCFEAETEDKTHCSICEIIECINCPFGVTSCGLSMTFTHSQKVNITRLRHTIFENSELIAFDNNEQIYELGREALGSSLPFANYRRHPVNKMYFHISAEK